MMRQYRTWRISMKLSKKKRQRFSNSSSCDRWMRHRNQDRSTSESLRARRTRLLALLSFLFVIRPGKEGFEINGIMLPEKQMIRICCSLSVNDRDGWKRRFGRCQCGDGIRCAISAVALQVLYGGNGTGVSCRSLCRSRLITAVHHR